MKTIKSIAKRWSFALNGLARRRIASWVQKRQNERAAIVAYCSLEGDRLRVSSRIKGRPGALARMLAFMCKDTPAFREVLECVLEVTDKSESGV